MQHYKARVLEGEEARQIIGDYFANDAPSEEKGTTSRKDLEPFFRGRVGEKVSPLLAKFAKRMISGMYNIPLRNLARNRIDNEVSLAFVGRLAPLRVSLLTSFLTVSFFLAPVKVLTSLSLQTVVICQWLHDVTLTRSFDLAKA